MGAHERDDHHSRLDAGHDGFVMGHENPRPYLRCAVGQDLHDEGVTFTRPEEPTFHDIIAFEVPSARARVLDQLGLIFLGAGIPRRIGSEYAAR